MRPQPCLRLWRAPSCRRFNGVPWDRLRSVELRRDGLGVIAPKLKRCDLALAVHHLGGRARVPGMSVTLLRACRFRVDAIQLYSRVLVSRLE
jgi:hypothetical protein